MTTLLRPLMLGAAALATAWACPALDALAAAQTTGPAATRAAVISLTEAQQRSVQVARAELRPFDVRREAVGYIDFNQDRSVAVQSPWSGRITAVMARTGDTVRKGAPLFTLDSPDLVQAESALLSTAAALRLASRALERARALQGSQALADKDLEQALSDQQTAQASYRAARDALRIFGLSDAQIDELQASGRTGAQLVVRSPIDGTVTARNAAPGLLVQPGATPAPITVSDTRSLWMVANVDEYDIPLLRVGQTVRVTVLAYPGQVFTGRLSQIGAAVDPSTHRIAVRADIADPQHRLKAQMLATFVIETGTVARSVGVPINGVIREGDGTMVAFVTRDGRRFERRTVRTGVEQGRYVQILSGLSAGEQVATDGALFLSNALSMQASAP